MMIQVAENTVVTALRRVEIPNGLDANGVADLTVPFDEKVDKEWTVVSSSSATVSPTAADSGKYYRLSHADPTFNLPTTGLVAGKTEFYLCLVGGAAATGTVDAGTDVLLDQVSYDISDAAFTGSNAQTAVGLLTFRTFHIKYVATGIWTSDIITQAA